MIANVLSVIVSACSFLFTSYVLCRLTYFLSSHDIHIHSDDSTEQAAFSNLFLDMLLLTVFILQHSLMASNRFKQICCNLYIEHLSRSIYNACNSVIVNFLINNWQQVPFYHFWHFSTSSSTVSILFNSLHVFAWSYIYSGCIMMDIAELYGLKQVFYRISGRNSPLDNKSTELKRYMNHMRHPSFTGFLIVLWLYPFMSLDRMLLAIVFTGYMVVRWTTDPEDYNYHVRYFQQKQMELS
ncbi:PREDICTED: nurim homolog [Dinoponera quadriceps]|uniref:Nuclear envelope membrane protein n=1 Tax=Dinoponera quadriceps TaxID=609295 RepID=A0A6P3Y649_DINQU|nr:PREDICTED: nurim homolog [Dinoponera quadriceps]